MKRKCLFLLLSVLVSSLYAEESFLTQPPQKAQEWISSHIISMDPHEVQLITNMLYFLYANSLINMKIREFVIPISQLSQAIRRHLTTNTNLSQELTTLKTLLERLKILNGAQEIYWQSLQHCQNACNTPQLKNALEALQEYGQKVLTVLAQDDLSNTQNSTRFLITELEKNIEELNKVNSFYKELDSKINQKNQQKNIGLMVLDDIINNNLSIMNITQQSGNITENFYLSHCMRLLVIGSKIYKDYYDALYAFNRYTKTTNNVVMFGMYGNLAEEYKNNLPHPDHVFEHILQTVKLYTHIELTQ